MSTARSEIRYGSWPHHVVLVREAELDAHLTTIEERRVAGILLHKGNDVALVLTREDALKVYHALGDVLIASGDR